MLILLVDLTYLFIAVAFCFARLMGHKAEILKDFDHVWAGIALGGWLFQGRQWKVWRAVFLVMVAVELISAFALYPVKISELLK